MLKQILLAALLMGSQIANANTYNLEDAGTYTKDLNTGLEWLDLSFTRGQSYNEVVSQLSSNPSLSGWRFATFDEFSAIFTSRGYGFSGSTKLTTSTGLHPYDYFFETLISNFGVTISSSGYVVSRGILADDRRSGIQNFQYYGQINFFGSPENNHGFATIGQVFDHDSGPQLGSFLVRESAVSQVPEPSTWILMMLGLIFIAYVNKKHHLNFN